MANNYRTPGVYVEEISTLPPSVAEVETAIPAFIGITEKGAVGVPTKISSLKEYEDLFGKADPEKGMSVIMEKVPDEDDKTKKIDLVSEVVVKKHSNNVLYYAMQLYYLNGGGDCYIVPAGNYLAPPGPPPAGGGPAPAPGPFTPTDQTYLDAIAASSTEDEPTLIVLPDAPFWLAADTYYKVMGFAVAECTRLGDRFAIIDVIQDGDIKNSVDNFRNNSDLSASDNRQLKYAAAYFPYLKTSISYSYRDDNDNVDDKAFVIFTTPDPDAASKLEDAIKDAVAAKKAADEAQKAFDKAKAKSDSITTPGPDKTAADAKTAEAKKALDDANALATAKDSDATALQTSSKSDLVYSKLNNLAKNTIKQKLSVQGITLTPCAAIAGVYASVDNAKGVWKAPANVALSDVNDVDIKITHDQQQQMNIDVNAGKSVNAIRPFLGRGIVIWGARTLDGNSNEWRYINVRRFFNMVEESLKKSTYWAVFESNDINTWIKVRAMIENYLTLKWRDGALAGIKPDDSFYVRVGLGQTMSLTDVNEGRMIIEIGLAAVRPAEFIILKFTHKSQVS